MVQQAKESQIKYVTMEMIRNNEKNLVAKSILTGLFKGIRIEQLNQAEDAEPDTFMLMQIKEKTLLTLCLKYYNILSLEKFDGTTKILNYFRASPEDQEKAFDAAATIVNELHSAGRTVADDAKIIDVGTYTQVPALIETPDTSTKSTTTGKKTTIVKSHTTYKPKEKEPSVIKRTTKKPTKAMLGIMAEKIKAISEGTLEVKLPEIEGDTEEEKETATTGDEDYDSDYFLCA